VAVAANSRCLVQADVRVSNRDAVPARIIPIELR